MRKTFKSKRSKPVISVHIWTDQFLGTAEKAKEFLVLIRHLDEGVWIPERWSQFEPLKGKCSPEADQEIVEKWTEWRHGRVSNCMLFKKGKPGMLLNVSIWKGRAPDLNYLWFEMDASEFSASRGLERLQRIIKQFVAWSGAVYATAWHSGQHHYRSAPGNPMTRLDQLNWLTFWGKAYIEFFGKQRILDCPFHSCEAYDGGLLALAAESWNSPHMTQDDTTLIRLENCLGPDAFVSGEYPTVPCRVPGFNTSETTIMV